MKPPANTEVFESEIATLWFENDGILYSASKSPRRTVENISENIALVKRITSDKKFPLLVYLGKSSKPDKATREFVARELPNVYKAMAIVSKSGLGKFIMNLLFSFKTPPIPMKTFSDEKEAKKWLKQYA